MALLYFRSFTLSIFLSSILFLQVDAINDGLKLNHRDSYDISTNVFCSKNAKDFARLLKNYSNLNSLTHPYDCNDFMEKFIQSERKLNVPGTQKVKKDPWLLKSVERKWDGRGAHRQIRYHIHLLQHIPTRTLVESSSNASPSSSSSSSSSFEPIVCSKDFRLRVLFLQCLPRQLFVDAFELQNLNLKGNTNICAIGDTDIEKPSSRASLSFIAEEFSLPTECSYGSKWNGEEVVKVKSTLKMTFPLHSRYLPVLKKRGIDSQKYSDVSVSLPLPFVMVKGLEKEIEMELHSQSALFSFHGSLWDAAEKDNSSSFVGLDTAWRIPVGKRTHLQFVSMFTTVFAFTGSLLLSFVSFLR